MKYTVEVEIQSPADKVVAFFTNPDNMGKKMEGLLEYELLSGTQGRAGAKSQLKFKWEKVIETIVDNNFPQDCTVVYDSKFVKNTVINKFVPLSDNKTKYITDQEFQFKGIMKVMGILMPKSMFKKQSVKYLQNFKNNVENEL